MKIIFAIRTKPDGTTRWEEIGLAFDNADGSLALKFHYFPVDSTTKIQIRENTRKEGSHSE